MRLLEAGTFKNKMVKKPGHFFQAQIGGGRLLEHGHLLEFLWYMCTSLYVLRVLTVDVKGVIDWC